MTFTKHISKRVCLIASTVLCIGTVCLAAAWSVPASTRRSVDPFTETDALRYTLRLGIDAKAAAIAGLSPAQLGAAIQAGQQHFLEVGAQVRTADTSVGAARGELDRIRQAAALGREGGSAQALAAARTALATATASRDQLMSAAFESATASLTAQQVAVLRRLAANRDRELPVEFGVLDKTTAEWGEITKSHRRRVAQIQRQALDPQAPIGEADPVWNAANSDPAVVQARLALANAPQLEAVWTDWLEELEPGR